MTSGFGEDSSSESEEEQPREPGEPGTSIPNLELSLVSAGQERDDCVVLTNRASLKGEAGNAIVNTQSKTALPIFSASNEPTWVTLLPKLSDSHLKLPQQGDPYWYIAS